MEFEFVRKVRLTLVSPILGACPQDNKLYETYIASKAPDSADIAEEIALLGAEEVAERGKTVFLRKDGRPCLAQHVIKGFFKEATKMMRRVPGSKAGRIKNYKEQFAGGVFINNHEPVIINFAGEMECNQRPLRIEDAAGKRTAIASSEQIPAGATMVFEIVCLTKEVYDAIPELLDYGFHHGIGQWRNGDYGRFTWEDITSNG